MYDPTYGSASLSPHLRQSDFTPYASLKTQAARKAARQAVIDQAVSIGREGFSALPVRTNKLSGTTIYQLTDLPSELILRKAAENLRRISHTKQGSRFEIVSRLKLLCQEDLPFRIAKFDIARFYESIDRDRLRVLLAQHLALAPATRLILNSFLDQCDKEGISGLPRGLAISAEMSELYMRQFDALHNNDPAINFYARYVDDIIFVSTPDNNLNRVRRRAIHRLPLGLRLNNNKTQLFDFSEQVKAALLVEHQFDYLGYSFSIYHIKRRGRPRKVTLDIAKSKVNKRKTRVILSILQYLRDRNFDDLRDRFKILTCNYRFFDHKKSRTRLAGTYHAYPCIDMPSGSIRELDEFLRKILLSNNGRICQPLSQSLTMKQRRELLQFSFHRGFEKNIQFTFPPIRLKRLVDCWKYA